MVESTESNQASAKFAELKERLDKAQKDREAAKQAQRAETDKDKVVEEDYELID